MRKEDGGEKLGEDKKNKRKLREKESFRRKFTEEAVRE